jgi:hypothetical protein
MSSCTSSPASSQPSSSPKPSAAAAASTPATEPAGYKRIGGAAQGISLDIPDTWVAVNFSTQSLQQAIKLFGLTGATQSVFTQELTPLVKAHAAYAADIRDAASAPGHFVTNINGYCSASGVSQTGSAGVTALGPAWASNLQQLGGQNISQTGVELGGVAGEQSSYTLSASSTITLHATQLAVLPKAGKACFVTLTAAGSMPTDVLNQVIASIEYA